VSRARILGTGSSLPRRVLTNRELEGMVDTSDEWITTRTGIQTRRIAGPGEETHRLAAAAGRQALDMAGIEAASLDLVVVATLTPHMMMPACACFVQAELGASRAFAYDLNAACSGFLYGLDLAAAYIERRPEMRVLLVGSENLSARTNWQDRNTCVLFGDGAGACVLGGGTGAGGVLGASLAADGSLWELLCMEGPPSMNPALARPEHDGCYIRMAGRDVFRHAVRAMEDAVRAVLAQAGVGLEEIALVIPHQANIRILRNLMERLALPEEKVYINLTRYGNTSAASIPIALDEANREGLLQPGDLILLCSFGGGFTWGALLLRW